MAYVLKDGKTYTDRYGQVHTSLYAIISDVIYVNKDNKVNVILKIFVSQEAKNNGSEPLIHGQKVCENWTTAAEEPVAVNDFDDFFGITVLNQLNKNVIKQSYIYWAQETRYGIVSDINPSDWESDE